jgi:signal peptidase I
MTRIFHHSTEGNALTTTLKKLWKNDYVQTVVFIGFIALAVLGFWFGAQLILNTPDPALAVVTGSMCIPQDAQCNGWTHPFDRTLHIGDLIILQGVNPADLNANYWNSDIIVFHKPTDPSDLIVHRIAAKETVTENGKTKIYFYTKGDGNPINKWPDAIQPSEYDPWGAVSEDLIVGKVVMRIPWVGHAILFMQRNPFGLPIVVALIIILVILEFIAPVLKEKKAPAAEPEQQKETQQQP